jgi:Asp-tRNA(Asn)/Glu-tRNA(Gln) amidotransferase A subunit family amidase
VTPTSLRAIAEGTTSGELDPGALSAAALVAIARDDGPLNSTPVVFDGNIIERQLAAAPRGPLYGVPLTTKDMYTLPWRGAYNGTCHEILPPSASGAYRRLTRAGAIIIGVANQHELGSGTTGTESAYGRHGNPWDPARSPGGSSGGSAAAVAAGFVPGSLGSDSGGSARIPAACCGVTGLKVTYGGVPRDGYTGAGTSLSAWGPIARDAADVRLLSEVLLDRELTPRGGASLRVGIVRGALWEDVVPSVADACRQGLEAAGWPVREIAVDLIEHAPAAGTVRTLAELSGAIPSAVLADAKPLVRALMLASKLWPASHVLKADRVRAAVRRALVEAFTSVDLIAWPTLPAPPCALEAPVLELPSGLVLADAGNIRQATVANLAGLPGISVPVPLADGLPCGLQLLAPWGEEARLLDAAEHLERATERACVDARPPVGTTSSQPG